jgi:hypothetical protein
MTLTPLQEALAPRSDQLNADDLLAGPRTIRISGARFVTGDRGSKKIIINFDGDGGKPWHPCKTMGRAMVLVWGIVDDPDEDKVSAQFVGKSVTLFRDPTVDFGNDKGIGGIRISHMSHIDGPKSIKLTVSQGKRGQFVFKPLAAEVKPIRAAPDSNAAEEWTASHIFALESATTLDELNEVHAKAEPRLKRLAASFSVLHQRIDDTYRTCAVDLMPAEQGRTDDQHGDQHDGASHSDAVGNMLDQIAAAKTKADLKAIDVEFQRIGGGVVGADFDLIETRLAAAAKALNKSA